MARKKRRRVKASEPAGGKAIAAYEHAERERANNPPVGLVTPETDPESPPGEYAFDPHLDPSLQWAGKAERTSFEVPTVSLHVHERQEPRTILEAVRKGAADDESQPSLFHADERPIREAVEFYRHRDHWTNRLIAGDSLLVMQSLLAKDGLGGQVQMVYMDPPYGVTYKSNFQPFANSSPTDNQDKDLTREPEQIRAFRDTWQLGVHSYLSYLRDRLLLARELLTESGSLFLQIGDENVHRAALVLDDVFGPANRVATISFATTSGSSSTLLPEVSDYLLWYAKDKRVLKYRQIYEQLTRAEVVDFFTRYAAMVEEKSGECRKPTEMERMDPVAHLPRGARFYKRISPTSQGWSSTGRSEAFVWQGQRIPCPRGRHWSVSIEGLNHLAALNRLDVEGRGGRLYWKWYEDEVPGRRVNNLWPHQMRALSKRFVVETAPSVVRRCVLMATDPGDLVLDPTCGSGTTAFVSEETGRRWVSCDTSRVALALARVRLTTASFDYFRLARPRAGVSGGFVYRTVPKVSPEILASESPPQATTIYDQPEKESGKKRVAGPFTVEAAPAPAVAPLTDEVEERVAPGEADASVARSGATSRRGQWLEELARAGIRGRGGQRLRFGRLEPLPGHTWIHADGETAVREVQTGTGAPIEPDAGLLAAEPAVTSLTEPRRVVVSFGPDFAPLDKKQVERALEEAGRLVPRPKVLVFAAFAFDPEAAKDIDETRWAGVTLLKAEMNTDLQTEDLKKRQTNSESFWLVGQPDVKLDTCTVGGGGQSPGPGTKYRVSVRGFDYFDIETGTVVSGDAKRIALWMLDPDYDGRSLYPRQVFFPVEDGRDGWLRLAKNLRGRIDQGRIRAYLGTESLPFAAGGRRRIAVKIVDDRGLESLRVLDLPPEAPKDEPAE